MSRLLITDKSDVNSWDVIHYWPINGSSLLKEQVNWSNRSGQPDRMVRFIQLYRQVFQKVSSAWNTLFHSLKHFVSLLETVCFIAWNTLFQGMKHAVSTVGTEFGTICLGWPALLFPIYNSISLIIPAFPGTFHPYLLLLCEGSACPFSSAWWQVHI